MVNNLKNRFSHVSADSWHWELTETFLGEKAQGKACTYYWFKLPLALTLYAITVICAVLQFACRAVFIAMAWFLGFRFRGKVFGDVTDDRNYQKYKVRRDGSKSRFAPWELILIPISAWWFWLAAIVYPDVGKAMLLALVIATILTVLIYFVTKGWKYPPIVKARASVDTVWAKACPPLVIEKTETKKEKRGWIRIMD